MNYYLFIDWKRLKKKKKQYWDKTDMRVIFSKIVPQQLNTDFVQNWIYDFHGSNQNICLNCGHNFKQDANVQKKIGQENYDHW